MAKKKPLLGAHAAACSYPGVLDEQRVERALAEYLGALSMKRTVVRLRDGWSLANTPSLAKYGDAVLDDLRKKWGLKPGDARAAFAASDALDARDALAARDARDASKTMLAYRLHRFTAWCVQAIGWGWWWRFDLSLLSTTHIGAVEREDEALQRWTRPIYDAFLAGAWMLHFTKDTLYWVAKPSVHTEATPTGRRLHNAVGAAIESDVEPLYFWHGVMVPSFVIIRPDLITVEHITKAENAEMRRVMIERYGAERYVTDIGAVREQADDYGELFRVKREGDSDLMMVRLENSTPEPDGTVKKYMLRVPPTMTSAHEAVAWTFGMTPRDYALAGQS